MLSPNLSPTTSLARRIRHRTKGRTHGPITRLMSPGDLGELVKPFVFLDYFSMENVAGPGMPDHPHSGIATHTTLLRGAFEYRDSTGKFGRLEPGSLEWMQAGGGVWHGGSVVAGPVRGYQLWVALPEELELAPAHSEYVDASNVEGDGRVRVLLGTHAGMESRIAAPSPMTYLHVRLQDGEVWEYRPLPGEDVAWLATHEGKLHVAGTVLQKEMAVFEDGNLPIELRAEGTTELVVGSAAKHRHPLVCGSYSVHTSESALVRGEAGIVQVAEALGPRGLPGLLAAKVQLG